MRGALTNEQFDGRGCTQFMVRGCRWRPTLFRPDVLLGCAAMLDALRALWAALVALGHFLGWLLNLLS